MKKQHKTALNRGFSRADIGMVFEAHKLYNLWDMVPFLADGLMDGVSGLRNAQSAIEKQPDKPVSYLQKQVLLKVAEFLKEPCKQLALTSSEEARKRLWRRVTDASDGELGGQVILAMIEALLADLRREVEPIQFALIQEKDFFEKEDLFGELVFRNFKSARRDIKDAGNCLAADLNTAAVFHLMRATEHGLRALAEHLKAWEGRSYPVQYAEWGKVIEAIGVALQLKTDEVDKLTRGPDKDELQEFYHGLVGDIKHIKLDRDKVMHTRGHYFASEATGIFERVRGFMMRLSEKVLE